MFFRGGGLAYTCWRRTSRIVDAKGDRELEPAGTACAELAVSANAHGFGERLYYTVDDTT